MRNRLQRILAVLCVLYWLAQPAALLAQRGGFYPKIGGLPTGSGFALGVGYQRSRLAGDLLDLRIELIGSFKKYEHAELWLDLPRLWDERLFVGLALRYRNYPEENFWGLGTKTAQGRETSYRLEDADYQGRFGYRPLPWLRLGVLAGYRQTNTGPGRDNCCPSVEELFSAADVPALDRQPHHAYAGAFVQLDVRNSSTDPRSGTLAEFLWTYFDDRDFDHFSFRQYEIQIQHYLAPFNQRGVFALRGLTILTGTSRGQEVPFFLQATVGGSRDLRGFRQSRFRDRNMLLANAEYRWAFRSFLDGIVFGDAGKVSRSSTDFRLSQLEGSVGIGTRLKFRGRVFLGFDMGWGREGLRFWVQGRHTF